MVVTVGWEGPIVVLTGLRYWVVIHPSSIVNRFEGYTIVHTESILMKALISVLALVLLISANRAQGMHATVPPGTASLTGTDSTSSLEAQFTALARTWMRAYNSGDSATLEAMYVPDADYISGHVRGLVAKGRARLIANFQDGVRMGGHIDSLTILSIHADCDLATLLCEYQATNSGQKAAGRTLLVMKKIAEKWRIVLHMTVV